MRFRRTPLMIAKDSNPSVGFVIRIEPFLECCPIKYIFVQKPLESNRGVECTEDLGRQTLHFGSQVLVERTGLSQ